MYYLEPVLRAAGWPEAMLDSLNARTPSVLPAHLRHDLAEAKAAGDLRRQGMLQFVLMEHLAWHGRIAEAYEAGAAAERSFRACGDLDSLAPTLTRLASCAKRLLLTSRAIQLQTECAALSRERGQPRVQVNALEVLAEYKSDRGQLGDALHDFRLCEMDLLSESDAKGRLYHRNHIAVVLCRLSRALQLAGRRADAATLLEEAARTAQDALVTARKMEAWLAVAGLTLTLAEVKLMVPAPAEAEQLSLDAMSVPLKKAHNQRLEMYAVAIRAEAALLQGKPADAIRLAEQALARPREEYDQILNLQLFKLLSDAHAAQDDMAASLRWLRAHHKAARDVKADHYASHARLH